MPMCFLKLKYNVLPIHVLKNIEKSFANAYKKFQSKIYVKKPIFDPLLDNLCLYV